MSTYHDPTIIPSHYHERPTRTHMERREVLLALPRDWTPEEKHEVRCIEAELERRGVLSIGLDF